MRQLIWLFFLFALSACKAGFHGASFSTPNGVSATNGNSTTVPAITNSGATQTNASQSSFPAPKVLAASGTSFSPFTLSAGQTIQAGGVTLSLQGDGNLVLTENGDLLWASSFMQQNDVAGYFGATQAMTCSGCTASFQADGNLVLYNASGNPYWASSTAGNSGSQLIISDAKPYLQIVSIGGVPLWNSTSGVISSFAPFVLGTGISITVNGLKLIMQTDGNLVLFQSQKAVWSSQTSGQDCSAQQCLAAFQSDGNLVVYNNGTPIWNSQTGGHPGSQLVISSHIPYLQIDSSSGIPLWTNSQIQQFFSAQNSSPAPVNSYGCNVSNFYQIPHANNPNENLFISRHLINTSSDPCSGTRWYLSLASMNWKTDTLSEIGSILMPPATIMNGAYTIVSAYDPTAIQYNGKTWVAFECVDSSGHVDSCIGPLLSNYQLDLSHTSVAIIGTSQESPGTQMSASVPKILNFQGNLYLYWTVCQFSKNGTLSQLTVRGTQIGMDPAGSGRMFAIGGSAPIATDAPSTVEVFGLNPADPTSNSTADGYQAITMGGSIFFMSALGGSGCTTPLFGNQGCYRFGIASSTDPLAYHTFNRATLNPQQLPGNPAQYAHFVKTPAGDYRILVDLLNNPTPTNHDLSPGMYLLPIPESRFFAPASTVNSSDPAPSKSVVASSSAPAPAPAPAPTPAAAPSQAESIVATGNAFSPVDLKVGQSLQSGDLTFTMQGDGNLVVYKNGSPLWATSYMSSGDTGGFSGPTQSMSCGSCFAAFQADGNLVLYNGNGAAYWNSGTAGNPDSHLVFSDQSPNVQIVSDSGVTLWTSAAGLVTSLSSFELQAGQSISVNGTELAFQADGNLVVYRNGSPLWATSFMSSGDTGGFSGPTQSMSCGNCFAAFQADGNLVLYNGNGAAYWNSGTAGNPEAQLMISAQAPFLEINSSTGEHLWSP